MADGVRVDPYRNFNFRVTASTKGLTGNIGFSKVSGLEAEVEVTEYREGTDAATVRKLPGLAKYPNIVLERGISDSVDLIKWFQEIVKLNEEATLPDDEDFRVELTIELLNNRKEVVRQWVATNAWPCKLTIGEFQGTSSDVVVETLEICHEGLSLISYVD